MSMKFFLNYQWSCNQLLILILGLLIVSSWFFFNSTFLPFCKNPVRISGPWNYSFITFVSSMIPQVSFGLCFRASLIFLNVSEWYLWSPCEKFNLAMFIPASNIWTKISTELLEGLGLWDFLPYSAGYLGFSVCKIKNVEYLFLSDV